VTEAGIAYDGDNYLLVWQDHGAHPDSNYHVMGSFISEMGVADTPFVISATASPRHNPLAIGWNGTRYLAVWTRDVGPGPGSDSEWDIFGRTVLPSGEMGDEFVVTAEPGTEMLPSVGSNGEQFLVAWSALDPTVKKSYAQLFDSSGTAENSAFVLFDSLYSRTPMNGSLVYGGGRYLSVATLAEDLLTASRSDVYGRFLLDPVAVEEKEPRRSGVRLSAGYPNPAVRTARISFTLPVESHVTLAIHDLRGRQVARLVDGETITAGEYRRTWYAEGMQSGVYFVRLRAGTSIVTGRLVLIR
jgi:hypothetical protein